MFEIKPKTRKEIYLAYLSGDMSLELPEPLTRDEVNLYNLCKNKAYGEYTTVKEVLTWDGVVLDDDPSGEVYGTLITYHRVSDDVPSVEQLSAGGIYTLCQNSEFMDTEFTSSDVQDNTSVGFIVVGPVIIACTDNVTAQGLTFPKAGIYFMSMPEEYASGFKVNGYQFETKTVTKISGKYVEGMGYSEKDYNYVIERQTVNAYLEEIPGTFGAVVDGSLSPDMGGKTYTVFFDGKEYKCTGFVKPEFDNMTAIGNLSILHLGDDTGEPFAFMYQGGNTAVFAPMNGEHEIAIYEVSETIHPIDPKFLPSGSGGGAVYYVGWSDDVGGWVLYKDENYSVGVTIEDFDSVLSAKAFRKDEEYVGFGGAFLGNEGGFALRLFVVNDNNSVVYIETKSADYKAGGPV